MDPSFRLGTPMLVQKTCPASASTPTPSGQWQSVTMTLLSEPSGFTVKTRPPLKSRTTRRPVVFFLAGVAAFGLGVCVSIIFPFFVCCAFQYEFGLGEYCDIALLSLDSPDS